VRHRWSNFRLLQASLFLPPCPVRAGVRLLVASHQPRLGKSLASEALAARRLSRWVRIVVSRSRRDPIPAGPSSSRRQYGRQKYRLGPARNVKKHGRLEVLICSRAGKVPAKIEAAVIASGCQHEHRPDRDDGWCRHGAYRGLRGLRRDLAGSGVGRSCGARWSAVSVHPKCQKCRPTHRPARPTLLPLARSSWRAPRRWCPCWRGGKQRRRRRGTSRPRRSAISAGAAFCACCGAAPQHK